ncbi:MBL fold metallo-hydrolase [Pleurocapsa sp. PCC 7319]|uniref:MBL fold metallo-hydrolase n=1 Tax=Pleurocapsa sp. PCC 7319 TaxID=118161 RepID=UPI000360F35A|nr:MBL fold metallo-hydrolase [Pleurocapsa sp. PCC 7319]
MKIHLIGHASLFVETQDCKILMDPLLFNPAIVEEMQDVCPKRELALNHLPEFDTLVISHKHIDHFDLRSLAYLPKHVDVFIPKDKLIETCLRKLGYQNIYTLRDWSEVRLGATHLLTTRSENRVPEYGMIFADEDGVFWNQVDSRINPDTIREVKSRYPQIDFLLAGWQPMLETQYQHNDNLSFPFSEYSKTLKLISLTKPKAIAPGANGYKFINSSAWLNQIVFPVTREQFCRDAKRTCPEIADKVFTFEPGDIITIDRGECTHLTQSSDFVRMVEDDRELLDFCPVNVDSRLIDDNLDGHDLHEMKKAIKQEVCLSLTQFFNQNQDSLFLEYCHWQVIYQLEVVFPDGSQIWHFDFSEKQIQCRVGRNPLANLFNAITASSLYGIMQGTKGWDYAYLGGFYRSFHKLYQATPYGIVKSINESSNFSFPQPLYAKFPYDRVYERVRNYETKKWGQVENSQEIEPENTTTIVIIGKTLTRVAKLKPDLAQNSNSNGNSQHLSLVN